jgi:hypothetical protein
MNDWQVFIEYRPGELRTFIYVARRIDSGVRQYLTQGGVVCVTVKDGEKTDNPDIHFIAVEDEYVLSLIVEALDKRGVKAPAQSYIEGKYQATSEHLQDLRKLIPKLTSSQEEKE